jgi:serine protease SohB
MDAFFFRLDLRHKPKLVLVLVFLNKEQFFMEVSTFFANIGLFAAKGFLVFLFFLMLVLVIAFLAAKAQAKHELKVENLKDKFDHYKHILQFFSLGKSEFKKARKNEKELEKKEKEVGSKPRAFVLNFDGDMRAQAVDQLRHEVTAILTIAMPQDLVVLNLESPGGVVHGYGLGAAQVLRLRDKNIPVTVCVDKVAASGGYLMSVPAQKIFAAPFAILGSIGVIAQVPNVNRLLKKFDVDYKEYTAGEFKRTVSLFGEVTEKG